MSIRLKNSDLLFLMILFAAILVLAFLTYKGILEETVHYLSYEIGNIDTTFGSEGNDYAMFVNFQSKGAFIAGRKIHVSIDLIAVRKKDMFRNADLKVVFPGALPYPIPKDITRIGEAYVEINFSNDSQAHGEKTIIYLMPELATESVIIPFKTSGKYTYNLLINMTPQTIDKFIRTNAFLHIAPLETTLQLKNNNLILILTYFAIYLAIAQIFLSLQKRKRRA